MKYLVPLFLLLVLANHLKAQPEIEDVVCHFMKIKSPLAKAICDSYKIFKTVKEFHDYTEDFKSKVEKGETPEKIDLLIKDKPSLKKFVSDLSFPDDIAFIAPEQDFNLDDYTNFNAQQRFEFNEKLLIYLKAIIKHIDILEDAEKGLTKYHKDLSAVMENLGEIEKTLWIGFKATGGGFTEFSSVFGYEALEIKLKTKPILIKLRRKLIKQNDRIKKEVQLTSTQKNAFNSWVNISLAAFTSNADNDIKLLEINIEQIDVALKYYSNKLDKVEQQEVELTQRIIMNKNEYNFLKNEENNVRIKLVEISNIKSEIKKYNSKLDAMRFRCPENNSFDKCIVHTLEKTEFTQIKNALTGQIMVKQKSLRGIQKQYNEQLSDYKNRLEVFNIELSFIKQNKTRIDNLKDEIHEKGRSIVKERFELSNKIDELETLKMKNISLIDSIN